MRVAFAVLVNALLSEQSVRAARASAGGRRQGTPEPPHTFESLAGLAWLRQKAGKLIRSQHPRFPFAVKEENNSLL